MDCELDVAIPAATQNEIELDDAKALVKKGVKVRLLPQQLPAASQLPAALSGLLLHPQAPASSKQLLSQQPAAVLLPERLADAARAGRLAFTTLTCLTSAARAGGAGGRQHALHERGHRPLP